MAAPLNATAEAATANVATNFIILNTPELQSYEQLRQQRTSEQPGDSRKQQHSNYSSGSISEPPDKHPPSPSRA
jgi:hypothetical protein